MAVTAGVCGNAHTAPTAREMGKAVGLLTKAQQALYLRPLCRKLFGQVKQRRRANAAAHKGNFFALQRKAVARRAGKLQRVALPQRRQLARARPLYLKQEAQCARALFVVMHADRAREQRRLVCRPGAQHIELARFGFIVLRRKIDGEKKDICRLLACHQDTGLKALRRHGQWPPSF